MGSGCKIGKVTLKDSGLVIHSFPDIYQENNPVKERMVEGLELLSEYPEKPDMYAGVVIWPDGALATTWAFSESKAANTQALIRALDELIYSLRLNSHLDF